MSKYIDILIAAIFILNLVLLASSLLSSCIKLTAFQGIAVGLLPLMAHSNGALWRAVALSAASIVLKGFVYPWILKRTLREVDVRREVEPFVSYGLSMFWGALAVILSLWVSAWLVPVGSDPGITLMASAGLTTILVGLFLIVTRRKAITQVLGYIVLENGIYALGIALVPKIPMLVELGALLDVFIAVFIMNIAAYHISREFNHIDVDRLDVLRG